MDEVTAANQEWYRNRASRDTLKELFRDLAYTTPGKENEHQYPHAAVFGVPLGIIGMYFAPWIGPLGLILTLPSLLVGSFGGNPPPIKWFRKDWARRLDKDNVWKREILLAEIDKRYSRERK